MLHYEQYEHSGAAKPRMFRCALLVRFFRLAGVYGHVLGFSSMCRFSNKEASGGR